MQQSLAQAVKVIDNKGTIYTIRNNKVTTATSAPTIPVEGDVWIDTSGTSTISKIFDDVDGWIIIDLDNVITNTTAPTTKNIGDVWFDTTTKLTKVFNGTNWIELGGTNTTFEVLGTDLQITDSKGTLSVPLSDLAHTGTTGSVFFAGTDGKPTENNSELFWDNTNNRLGVGADNPTNKLEVSGATGTQGVLNSNGTVTEPSYRFKNDTDTGIFRPNLVDEMGFSAGGIEALHIEEDANITLATIKHNLALDGKLFDINDEAGTNGQVLSSTATGTDWVDVSSLETVTTITNTVAGHKIADYTNENGGTPVTINETVTSLTQDDTPTSTNTSATGEITFSDENGNTTGKAQVVSANADNKIEVGNDGGAYLGPTVYTGFFIIEYNGGNSDVSITLPFKPSQVTFVSHANVDSLNSNGRNPSINTNTIINSFGSMNGFANASTGTLVQQVIYVGGSGTSINNIGWFSSSSHVIGVRYGNQDGDNLGVIEGALSFTASGFDIAVNYASTGLSNANRNRLRLEKLVVLYTAYK